jgi:hypothetical protein
MIRLAATATAVALFVPVIALGSLVGGAASSAPPSSEAVADIPRDYLAWYQRAADAYRVPWELLAAVGKAECDHGRHPHPSCSTRGAENYAGAGGPMQFLAPTWDVYGIDADRDGAADRWTPADAIYGAANYLRASGAPADIDRALFAYNHSAAYVADVRAWMSRYRAASPASTPIPGDAAALAAAVLSHPRIELRPDARADIAAGRIDARLLTVLLVLGSKFDLAGVGPLATGHSFYVADSTRPSNHAFGRAVDIGLVNGEPVSAANRAARALALAVAALPPELRPSEIGTPFVDLTAAGFFTDAAHQDHVHLGYDS